MRLHSSGSRLQLNWTAASQPAWLVSEFEPFHFFEPGTTSAYPFHMRMMTAFGYSCEASESNKRARLATFYNRKRKTLCTACRGLPLGRGHTQLTI
eukprot:7389123-Prymnesium_polylepis.2